MTFDTPSQKTATAGETAATELAANPVAVRVEAPRNKLASARLYVKRHSKGFFTALVSTTVGRGDWHAVARRGILSRMGRQKTITDEEVLRIARNLFREQGHTATTREIAQAAGISEAILYQRFGSKDELFFAAMHPHGPDLEHLLGPEDPSEDALTYVHRVVVRLAEHFADVIPLALRVMMHPSFDPASLARVQPGGPAVLQEGLAERLASLARRGELAMPGAAVTARLLLSLAHDWALRSVHGNAPRGVRELKDMVNIVWEGLRPRGT
jgi:AcrR family transcriptional regulator